MLIRFANNTQEGLWTPLRVESLTERSGQTKEAGKSSTVRNLTKASAGFSTWNSVILVTHTDWGRLESTPAERGGLCR